MNGRTENKSMLLFLRFDEQFIITYCESFSGIEEIIPEENPDELAGSNLLIKDFIKKSGIGEKLTNNITDKPVEASIKLNAFSEAKIKVTKEVSNGIFSGGLLFIYLLKTESDLQEMLNSVQFPSALIKQRKCIWLNAAFKNEFGFVLSENPFPDPLDLVSNSDIPSVASVVKELERKDVSKKIIVFQAVQDPEGKTAEYSAALSSFSFRNEEFILMSLLDISESRKNQDELENEVSLYRTIEQETNVFIWSAKKTEGKLRAGFYSQAVEKVTGFTVQDFLKNPRLWLKVIFPDDRKEVIRFFKRVISDTTRTADNFEYRITDYYGNILWLNNHLIIKRDDNGNVVEITGFVSDISGFKRRTIELENDISELTSKNDAKDRFISIISHDLRAPFTSIIGYANYLLENDDAERVKTEEYLHFIMESASSTLNLVNALLEWTRLQTGRIKFNPAKINASEVLANAIEMLTGAAIEKGISIKSEFAKDVFITADKDLMLQVVINLISNAIKFTKSGGTITVSAFPDPASNKYIFSVKDTGVGIKEDDFEKLFNIDSKFTSRGTKGEKGTGLGLSLCRDIVKKHNGNIWLESQTEKGTTFYFSMPVVSNHILLIDSQKTERLLYKKLISGLISGYNIIEAKDGYEALQMIKRHQPVLVLTEHNLGGMSGFQLVKHIALGNFDTKPQVIVLTHELNKSVIDEYKLMGIENVFTKPVEIKNFRKVLQQTLSKPVL